MLYDHTSGNAITQGRSKGEIVKVILNGKQVEMEAARVLMGDLICESIHGLVGDDQEFLDVYIEVHRVKYGEEFAIN